MAEAVGFALAQVIEVFFVSKGFLLEGDLAVAFAEESDHIPDVERKNQQFELLPEVNAFMIDQACVQVIARRDNDEGKDGDGTDAEP